MGSPSVGDIVLAPFPFSDLSASKLRPAVVAALAEFGDVILCQITSQPYSSRRALILDDSQLLTGSLDRVSYIRPDKLFTASPELVRRTVATMRPQPLKALEEQIAANFV